MALGLIMLVPVGIFSAIHIWNGEWSNLVILWFLYGLFLFVLSAVVDAWHALFGRPMPPPTVNVQFLHADPTRPDRMRDAVPGIHEIIARSQNGNGNGSKITH